MDGARACERASGGIGSGAERVAEPMLRQLEESRDRLDFALFRFRETHAGDVRVHRAHARR